MLDSSTRKMQIIMAACGLSILMTLTLGIALCSPSRLSQASAIARLVKMRLTSGTPKMSADSPITSTRAIPAVTATAAKPASAAVASAPAPAPAAVISKPLGAIPSSRVKAHPVAAGAPTVSPTTAAPPSGATVVAAATVAARRTPTAAEISQAISAVHQLVPFFTPTAAQVARVGNQVCTAFDQGRTFAQVKSTISALLGRWSWLLPSSVATQGVRTTVSLFCPGYASRLV